MGSKKEYVFRINLVEGLFTYDPDLSYNKTILCEIYTNKDTGDTGFVHFEADGTNANPSHGVPYREIQNEPKIIMEFNAVRENGYDRNNIEFRDNAFSGYLPFDAEASMPDSTLIPIETDFALMNAWIDYSDSRNWKTEGEDWYRLFTYGLHRFSRYLKFPDWNCRLYHYVFRHGF